MLKIFLSTVIYLTIYLFDLSYGANPSIIHKPKYDLLRDQAILANAISLKNAFKHTSDDYVFSPAGLQLGLGLIQFSSTCPNLIKGLLPPAGCSELNKILRKFPKGSTYTKVQLLNKLSVCLDDSVTNPLTPRIQKWSGATFGAQVSLNDRSQTNFNDMLNGYYRDKSGNYLQSFDTNPKFGGDEHDQSISYSVGGSLIFKSLWFQKFKKIGVDTFYAQSKPSLIPMIYGEVHHQYGYYEEIQAEIIIIPYRKQYKMIYILPVDENVTRLELSLKKHPNIFHQIRKRNYPTYPFNIQVPYIDMQTNLDMVDVLGKELTCHIKNLDLLLVTNKNITAPIQVPPVSQIHHNTRFTVTPLGTGQGMDLVKPPLNNLHGKTQGFVINKPHLFYVVEDKKAILLKGRFANPKPYEFAIREETTVPPKTEDEFDYGFIYDLKE